MSYDLAVFRPVTPLDAASAGHLHERICARRRAQLDLPELEASPGLEAFYRALVARHAELAEDDESPFSCAIDRADRWVVLSVVFSQAEEVAAFVRALAHSHGLDCYDPQRGTLTRAIDAPPAAPAAPSSPKLSPREGLKRLRADVEPAMARLGFAPVPGASPGWERATHDGVVQRVSLNLGTSVARLELGFGARAAMSLVARARPDERRLLPTALLQALWFRGWLPGEPWSTEDDDAGAELEHAFCHEACVARAVEALPLAVARFALPLFARMPDAAALDVLLDRREPFEIARKNWGGTALWQQAWNPEASFLHRVALARVVRDAAGATRALDESRAQLAAWKAAKAGWYKPELEAQLEALAALELVEPTPVAAPRRGRSKPPGAARGRTRK